MKYSILFVDDDRNLLDGLRRSLHTKEEEWQIRYALSANEALALCDIEHFDIIVSDYKMPGMDGLDLFARVKQKNPTVKKILFTGQSEEETFERAQESVDLYLSKPCSASDLILAIENLINGGSL